jgi:hypothetical protein
MASEYTSYDIRQLFAMVTAAKQTLGPSHEQIGALHRAEQMLRQHGTALRGLRDQLAAKWPPESNAAAAAYLGELDRLVQAVDQTGRAAVSNAAQVDHVSDAINQAHAALRPLHDEYVGNESKIAKYHDTVDTVVAGVAVIQGPVAGLVTKGAAALFTSPPVDDGRQEQLQRQARQAMDALGGVARDATVALTAPPDYAPPIVRNDRDTPLGGDTAGGAARPPTIDPPVHQRAETLPAGDTGPSTGGPSSVTGPALSGALAPTAPTAPPGPAAPTGVAPPPGAAPVPVLLPPGVGGPTGRAVTGSRAPGLPSALDGATGVRAHSPGGRIDGLTGAAVSRPGQGAGPRSRVQRVSPVGGVIGQPAGGATASSPSTATGRSNIPNTTARPSAPHRSGTKGVSGGIAGNPPVRRGRPAEDGPGRRWDPADPWAVAQGVAPVIAPDPAVRVQVGPGVIGLDR